MLLRRYCRPCWWIPSNLVGCFIPVVVGVAGIIPHCSPSLWKDGPIQCNRSRCADCVQISRMASSRLVFSCKVFHEPHDSAVRVSCRVIACASMDCGREREGGRGVNNGCGVVSRGGYGNGMRVNDVVWCVCVTAQNTLATNVPTPISPCAVINSNHATPSRVINTLTGSDQHPHSQMIDGGWLTAARFFIR
jgi:hypothetical protein